MSSNVAKNRASLSSGADGGLIARLSRTVSESPITVATSRAATDAKVVTKKLLWSTGRAAWIAGTTFLILAVPLIIEMDREQQFNELELQQQSLLGASPPASALK